VLPEDKIRYTEQTGQLGWQGKEDLRVMIAFNSQELPYLALMHKRLSHDECAPVSGAETYAVGKWPRKNHQLLSDDSSRMGLFQG
jgi:hypothetical protein